MLETVSPRRQSSDWREGNADKNNQHEAEQHDDLEGMNGRKYSRGWIEIGHEISNIDP